MNLGQDIKYSMKILEIGIKETISMHIFMCMFKKYFILSHFYYGKRKY